MFAKTYFDNAVRCFSRWLDMLATDRTTAWEYHARGMELIATVARIRGLSERDLRAAAFNLAIDA